MFRGVARSIRIRIGIDNAVKPRILRNGTRCCEHTRRREQRESRERGTGDWLQSYVFVRGRRFDDSAPRRCVSYRREAV